MAAAKYDFSIEQGATFSRTIIWTDAVGNVVNLTGYTGKLQLRDKAGGSLYLELNSTNGGITFNATSGQILLNITASQTAALTALRMQYDLELTDPSGNVIRLLQGRVKLSEEVTQ